MLIIIYKVLSGIPTYYTFPRGTFRPPASLLHEHTVAKESNLSFQAAKVNYITNKNRRNKREYRKKKPSNFHEKLTKSLGVTNKLDLWKNKRKNGVIQNGILFEKKRFCFWVCILLSYINLTQVVVETDIRFLSQPTAIY